MEILTGPEYQPSYSRLRTFEKVLHKREKYLKEMYKEIHYSVVVNNRIKFGNKKPSPHAGEGF
jgi:hypothetical protein